jgi:nitrate reductase gamma subunit
MYLRRHDKRVDGETYGYWSLMESVRTARGPRQRIVATIGKLPGLDREERIGSLFTFQPKIEYVVDLPFIAKLHMLLGFGIIGLFPFTRLVHIISFPLRYLWRPLQVVIWNRHMGKV